MKSTRPPRVGISSCLLGEEVRWDGGHQRQAFLADVLGRHVEWVRVCPEVEMGLSVPREAMAFVRFRGGLRLLGIDSGQDRTRMMRSGAGERAEALASAGLCGYVLKSGSPSCGLDGARVYASLYDFRGDGPFERSARGIFAEALATRHPQLPIVEETAFEDRVARDEFVERVFALHRLHNATDLAAFHARHELQIISHSAEARKRLDTVVAGARERATGVTDEYAISFAEALAVPSTRERHVGALRRAWNRVQGRLGRERRREVDDAIRAYGCGSVHLDVPRKLLAEAARAFSDRVLVGQTYLEPDPRELAVQGAPEGPRDHARDPG